MSVFSAPVSIQARLSAAVRENEPTLEDQEDRTRETAEIEPSFNTLQTDFL